MTVVSGSGFQFSVDSTGGTWSWTVVSRSIPGVGVFYDVVDLQTPWGPISQTAIPIPSDVILAVAETVVQIQQQLAPQLVLPPPATTTFFITITEGDPNSVVAEIPVANQGAFGSSMTVSATPSAPWLKATPAVVQGLGKNDQAVVSVTLLAASLLFSGSPYIAVVNLQDNRTPPTLVPVAFQVTVLPRPVIAASSPSVAFVWYQSSSSGSGPFSVDISNAGPAGSVLDWTAAKLQNISPWLAFSPSSGGPLSPPSSDSVQFSLVSAGVPTLPGTYVETVRFSSPNAQNGYVDVSVSLVVTP